MSFGSGGCMHEFRRHEPSGCDRCCFCGAYPPPSKTVPVSIAGRPAVPCRVDDDGTVHVPAELGGAPRLVKDDAAADLTRARIGGQS